MDICNNRKCPHRNDEVENGCEVTLDIINCPRNKSPLKADRLSGLVAKCNDSECGHFDNFFDDNCGGRNMENCLKTKTESVDEVPCGVGLSDNLELRKLLWLGHGCTSLYGDDGEMQCNCGPHKPIDFKRDSVKDIKIKLLRLGR